MAKCHQCGAESSMPDNANECPVEQADEYSKALQKKSEIEFCVNCGTKILRGAITCSKCFKLGAQINYDENNLNFKSSNLKDGKMHKFEIVEIRGCVGVLRFMAWGYFLASITGAIAVWILYGSVPKYLDNPSLGNIANPLGITQGFAVLVQGLLMCPFFLCIASIAEDTAILTSKQRKEREQKS